MRSGAIGSLLIIISLSACSTTPQWVAIEEAELPQRAEQSGFTQASYAAPERIPTEASDPPLTKSVVGPGYLIKVTEPQDPALNGTFRVEREGSLKLPYGVQVQAANLTTSELQEKIRSAFKPYLRNPQTHVAVVERKLWIEVRGLVEKPGTLLIDEGADLDEVIAQGGGLRRSADQTPLARFARITKGANSELLRLSDYYSGLLTSVSQWSGGEVVFFQREGGMGTPPIDLNSQHIQIMGQVKEPGEYLYKPSGDFFYYLSQAGGFTDRADIGNLMLVRSNGGQRKALSFSIDQIKTFPEIQRGDIILVHADNPSSTEKRTRIMSELGQFFGSIATSILLVGAL